MKAEVPWETIMDLSILNFLVFDIWMYYKYLFLCTMKHYLSAWIDKKEIYEFFDDPVVLRLNQWLKLYWQEIKKLTKFKKKQNKILCNISVTMSILMAITMHWYVIRILCSTNFYLNQI